MNIDRILKFFIPKDGSFYPLFEGTASLIVSTSTLLKQLLNTNKLEDREIISVKIKQLESDGDSFTTKIFKQLNKSFITPFDREDIHKLASDLDNVLDYINGVSQKIFLLKPKEYQQEYNFLADIIIQSSIEIENAIKKLSQADKNRESIMESCKRLNKLESHADDIYHAGLSRMFDQVEDTRELIKHKEILATLERSVDMAEDV